MLRFYPDSARTPQHYQGALRHGQFVITAASWLDEKRLSLFRAGDMCGWVARVGAQAQGDDMRFPAALAAVCLQLGVVWLLPGPSGPPTPSGPHSSPTAAGNPSASLLSTLPPSLSSSSSPSSSWPHDWPDERDPKFPVSPSEGAVPGSSVWVGWLEATVVAWDAAEGAQAGRVSTSRAARSVRTRSLRPQVPVSVPVLASALSLIHI
jgi:hypothetical protein